MVEGLAAMNVAVVDPGLVVAAVARMTTEKRPTHQMSR